MKTITSLTLALMACGVASAQTGFSGSMGTVAGITITFESKLEPPKPEMQITGASGTKWLSSNGEPVGMRRFTTNNQAHQYFGYDMKVEAVDAKAGTYRLTFSALTLTPEDLKLPEPGRWRLLPAPVFPPPQIVSLSDTIALDLFESPATGQKIVDYIRLKRDNCDSESEGLGQIDCLTSLVQDARRSLESKLAQMEASRDPATVASLKSSQQSWEKYRDDACSSLATEAKRLQCELKLTRSHTHDLSMMYQ